MPILNEKDALLVRDTFDLLSDEEKPRASEWMQKYEDQQNDLGEPLFPSQVQAMSQNREAVRKMFDGVDKVQAEISPWSENPNQDRAVHANMALLSDRYGKKPQEIADRYEFYLNDYAAQKFGMTQGVDDLSFYAAAAKEIQREKQKEDTEAEGMKAALRGDAVIPSLQAWQAKNLDRMPDSTEYTRGFLQAREAIAGIGVSDAVDAYQRAMQGAPKDGDDETLKEFEALILDLPGAKRKAVLTAAAMMAKARGENAVKGVGARESGPMGGAGAAINAITGFFQEIGESGGRFAGKMGGIAKDEELEVMVNLPTIPLITDAAKAQHPLATGVAYTSLEKIDSAEKAAEFIKEWKVTSFGTASAGVTRADIDEANQTAKQYRELGADEKKLIEAAQKRELKKNQIARELRSIAESSDPVGEISGAIGSSVAMAAANILTRGKTLPISWQLYSEANYDQLRLENPSLEPSEARSISRVSGAGEAALDAFEIGILRKLPSVAAVFKSGTSAAWRNAGGRLGATFAFEQVQEGVQDLTLPFTRAVFEAVGIDTGLDMGAEWERWKDSRGTVAIASIPLILLGAGIATHQDIKDAQNLLSSRDRLGEQGIIEVEAVPILEAARAGKMDEAQALYREAFKRRSSEVAAEYQDKLDTQQKAVAEAVVEVTRQGLIPDYTLLPGGKVIVTDLSDGSKATFDSWRDAQPVIEQNMNEMERINNDSILRIADDILQKKGEEVTVSSRPSDSLATRVRGGSMSPEDAIKAAIAANVIQGVNIDDARKIAADVFGESQEERIKVMRDAVERAIILGSNVVEGGVSKSKLFKGANLATLIEETSEGRLKEGLRLGRYKKSDWLGLIQQAEEATGEKFLIGSTSDAVNASPDFAPRALVEAVSRIVVADVLGRLQDGRRIGSGSITKSLEENNSPLVAWVRAFKRLLASVLQTAKRIREARKTGKLGDEYDAYIDDLLGVDQQAALESEAAAEAEAIANEALNAGGASYSEENPGPNGETFSIGRVKNGGRLLTFEKPIETPLGRVVSYEWQSDVIEDVDKDGEAVLKRVSDWDKAISNAETGRAIVHHFTVIQPDGTEKIVSLESALKATKGTEAGKALSAAVKAARRLPLREAELIELEKLQGDYDAAIKDANSQSWRNAPEPELRTPEFPPLAERGVRAVYVGDQFIKNLEPNELGAFGYKPAEIEWKKQWAIGQLQRPPYGTLDRIQTLRRLIKKDKALIDSASLFSSRAIPAGSSKVVQMPDGARLVGPTTFSIRAFHGTQHKVDRFRLANIGTGEGAQVYGWGLYFAQSRKVAQSYQKGLTERDFIRKVREVFSEFDSSNDAIEALKEIEMSDGQRQLIEALRNEDWWGFDYPHQAVQAALREPENFDLSPEVLKALDSFGQLYTVELLADEADFLDWDKPLSEQSEKIRDAASELMAVLATTTREKLLALEEKQRGEAVRLGFNRSPIDMDKAIEMQLEEANASGAGLYKLVKGVQGKATPDEASEAASQYLASLGIPGIKYLDGGSRGAGEGTSNYVIFDENLVKILEENGKPVETFSLRSGDFASRMAAAFSPFQRNPELRLAIAQVAKARALKLGAEWIEKASVIRTSGDIGKEARMREALAYETRMNDYLDGLTPNARQTLEFEPSALEDDPFVSAMLDYGKLMSFTNAKKAGKVDAKAGDYDGVPWLPSSFYSKGAGIMPDQMAQAMNDAGLLPDAYADTLWNELGKRIASTKKDKAAHREAVSAYKAAQKYARDASRAEADQWAESAKKKAGSPKAQRDMLKAALRTLDGILAAAPPEVRARVGGYVKLAGLATDEAMLQEIERRIEKLNVELEKYLKKEGIEQIEKLFKKARPDSEAGKKDKGKNADMHALFAAAERAAKMDEVAVAGELARLDSLIGGDTLTPEQEAMAITERGIVELVGDLKHADAGRVFSALDTLRDIYEGGWIKWKLAQIEKREERAGMRAAFIADTGKSGIKPERDAAEREAETLLGKIKNGFLSLSSFHEVLSYAFGSNSARVKSLVDAEREAAGQYEDVNQALADEVQDLFTGLAGGKILAGEKLRFDMAQRTIQTAKGELSQLGAIQALLMWRQEDGRRHMEGQLGEDGKPISSWSYDQAWIDEITAQLTPEAKSVMAWIMQKYGAEHAVLNPLYRQRYGVNMPAHDNYAPITVQPVQAKAGEVIDPVSGAAMSSGSILTPGSLRTRSRNAIAEPEFRDALQTLLMHTRQLEYWKAYYDLALESSAILGNREVLNSVKAKGGEQAATALRKWIDAIAQGGFRDASASLEMNKMLQRMTGRAASVGLLGRFSTLLVQSTQLAAASVKMPLGAYISGFVRLWAGLIPGLKMSNIWGDAIRSPFIQRRYKSAPPIVRQAMEGLAAASRPNQIKRATRALGQLLSGTDALFTAGTYALLLDYHRGTGRALGLTGADLEEHAHTEAQRDTEQVAQPTRMAARSLAEITSTNPLAKVSWAYASEARQKIALMAWAATKAKSEPAQFAKTAFLVFGVGGLLTQVLKGLWREAKGDDDEKKWSAERLTLAALTGPLHGVPLASELMGDQGMLSGVAWAWPALKDVASGEADMRDVDTLLSTLGLFNDTAAAVASLSHAGLDAAKVIENLADKK